jgi:HPt (histidine-containing phosphotransfer) domain-containing protein
LNGSSPGAVESGADMDESSVDRTAEVLDAATLATLADQLDEGFDALVVRFRRRLAWMADERIELAREAHSLKSVAGTFGALAVARTSAELEKTAGSGSRKELDELLSRLDRDCAAARSAVAKWSAGHVTDPDGAA